MPRPDPLNPGHRPPEPDLAEILRLCLSGLAQPLPALAAWLDRIEARP